MSWQRFNTTSNVFEVSNNNGGAWSQLPNIAYQGQINTFTVPPITIQNMPDNVGGFILSAVTSGWPTMDFRNATTGLLSEIFATGAKGFAITTNGNLNWAISCFASGGVYIGGPTPLDPGANNLTVAGGLVVNGTSVAPWVFNCTHASGGFITVQRSGTGKFYCGSAQAIWGGALGTADEGMVYTPNTCYVSATSIVFANGSTKRWEINTAGGLVTGVQAAGNRFIALDATSGLVTIGNTGTALSTTVAFYNGAGQIGSITTLGSATAYGTSSDQRLKKDLGIAHDLTGLREVVVHDFEWKADGARDRGVFAQEAITIFPRAISEEPWMTDYSKFVPDLIVGWQQHEARIAALERK